jgi:hypothetical protein
MLIGNSLVEEHDGRYARRPAVDSVPPVVVSVLLAPHHRHEFQAKLVCLVASFGTPGVVPAKKGISISPENDQPKGCLPFGARCVLSHVTRLSRSIPITVGPSQTECPVVAAGTRSRGDNRGIRRSRRCCRRVGRSSRLCRGRNSGWSIPGLSAGRLGPSV